MELGVCYYPEHWPEELWEQDAAEMKSIGLSIVRIGEFAWSRLEPEEGRFEFDWLDRSIDILGKAGLKIILGTPSATPPRWVMDKFPDMIAHDKEGKPRTFGSRRHYSFSHEGYKEFAAQMAERFAIRYGSNPYIMAWQVDNEYSCHDTTRSYGAVDEVAFQKWLVEKYQSIKQLNARWGNVFWSMEYGSFKDISLPHLTVTEANPAHVLDFYRFSSDQVALWNKVQVASIRRHSDLPIMHNYMGRITDFDHYKVGDDLDFATWDSYPLGFLEDRTDRSVAFQHAHQYCGDLDLQAFHHDLYRTVGKGRWAVMEQQPGPVNWAPYNPAPDPGVVRMWTLEAFAHGAEFVAYFRWRQAPFAQEQMHSAIKRADNAPSKVYDDIKALAKELADMEPIKAANRKVALVFDYESQWAWEVQPQGKSFDYFKLVYEYYCSMRQLGIQMDIIRPDTKDISAYSLVCLPGLFSISKSFMTQLKEYKGQVLLGPRCHTKTEDFQLNLASVSELMDIDINIVQIESLRPTSTRNVEGIGDFKIWMEELSMGGVPGKTIIQALNYTYIAGWPETTTLRGIIKQALDRADVSHELLPDGERRSENLVINYKEGNAEIV